MSIRKITTQSLLESIAEHLELETHKKAIVLISNNKKSVTLTIPRGNYVGERWRVHVVKEA